MGESYRVVRLGAPKATRLIYVFVSVVQQNNANKSLTIVMLTSGSAEKTQPYTKKYKLGFSVKLHYSQRNNVQCTQKLSLVD